MSLFELKKNIQERMKPILEFQAKCEYRGISLDEFGGPYRALKELEFMVEKLDVEIMGIKDRITEIEKKNFLNWMVERALVLFRVF